MRRNRYSLLLRDSVEEFDEGVEDLRTELAAVERAERRLIDSTHHCSVESGEPIPDQRLEAVPTAERTAEEQAQLERQPASYFLFFFRSACLMIASLEG